MFVLFSGRQTWLLMVPMCLILGPYGLLLSLESLLLVFQIFELLLVMYQSIKSKILFSNTVAVY